MSGKGIVPVYQKSIDTENVEDKELWYEMLAYAKSIGVPERQCDFLPEGFNK